MNPHPTPTQEPTISEKLVHQDVQALEENGRELRNLKAQDVEPTREQEIAKVQAALDTEKNLDKITFYEGYLKGLQFREPNQPSEEKTHDEKVSEGIDHALSTFPKTIEALGGTEEPKECEYCQKNEPHIHTKEWQKAFAVTGDNQPSEGWEPKECSCQYIGNCPEHMCDTQIKQIFIRYNGRRHSSASEFKALVLAIREVKSLLAIQEKTQPSEGWEKELLELSFWQGGLTANEVREHFVPFIKSLLTTARREERNMMYQKLSDWLEHDGLCAVHEHHECTCGLIARVNSLLTQKKG